MIKNLSGDFETVEYESKRSVLLHDNHETEAYPVHWHDALELVMPLENKYVVNVAEKDYVIEEHEVLIVPPSELHSMPYEIPGHRIIFQCDNSMLSGVPAVEPVMRGLNAPLLITKKTDSDLHSLAKKIMLDVYSMYNKNSELDDVRIYTAVINLLTAVRRFQLEQSKLTLECDDEKLVEYSEKFNVVMQYIDANYMYDLSLDQLAGVAGYSKFHFSRIFKQYYSMSYLQYLNARRTKAAERLLLDPDLTVTEVAMRSGFKSLTTFNRIFKEIKHCTPTDFKKLYALH